MNRKTHVSIRGEKFYINDELTYKGRYWNGHKVEGLLFNSRMVQATFDDLNDETRYRWDFPDGSKWDPDRNTSEFLAQMPTYRDHGLLAITVNLQGGSPYGYSDIDEQIWTNSAINPDGSLRPEYMARMEKVIDKADELGIVIILGIFYFGQEKVLQDQDAFGTAVDNVLDWLFEHAYRNVIIEVNNECNIIYKQPVMLPENIHKLIERVAADERDGYRYLVGTSYGGNHVPRANVVQASDFILMHGNSVKRPARIAEMVRQVRQVEGYRTMPILFNEDDHFDFDKPTNNMLAALSEYASWGFFDYRMEGEDFDDGYQSVPVNWGLSSDRKRGFFTLLKDITGI